MENALAFLAAHVALALELLVVIAVAIGAVETLFLIGRYLISSDRRGARRAIWMRFARWLLLALEFALGADIIRTVLAPSWDDLGQLAVIAVLRTGLGFFLERDIEAIEVKDAEQEAGGT